MAYYQILDAPTGSFPTEGAYRQAGITSFIDKLKKEDRQKSIQEAISQYDLTPEISIDEAGESTTKYKAPQEKDFKKQLQEDFLRKVSGAGSAEEQDFVTAQASELEKSVSGLPKTPAVSLEELQLGKQPVSQRPEFKRGRGLSALFSPDVAKLSPETEEAISHIKSLKDLVRLITNSEKASSLGVDMKAIKEYFGEEVYNQAVGYVK